MEGIKMENTLINLVVIMFIMTVIMFCVSTGLAVYVVMFVKLGRDKIKNPGYDFSKEMKEISGNNDDGDRPYDEIDKRHRLSNFLKTTTLERAKTNRKYSETETINSGKIIEKINETVEEPESYKKVDQEYGEEEIDFIHEKLIENEKLGLDEKSIKEELESLSIVNFDKDDIPYQSKIERSIEETDLSCSFIEGEEITELPIIEDTEIIFEKQNDNLSLDLFRSLSNEQQLKVAKTLIQEKFNDEDCPKDCKDILISKKLEKYCKNAEMLDFEDKKVTVNKDFTGKYKFDFDISTNAIEDIYKCNHENNYNQGYQL
jgi:hypothetical protein